MAAYQAELTMLAGVEMKKLKLKRLEVPYSMTLTFYLKDKRHGDLTNLLKCSEDALCDGLLAINDRFCREAHVYIFYDKDNPRLSIEVSPLSNR